VRGKGCGRYTETRSLYKAIAQNLQKYYIISMFATSAANKTEHAPLPEFAEQTPRRNLRFRLGSHYTLTKRHRVKYLAPVFPLFCEDELKVCPFPPFFWQKQLICWLIQRARGLIQVHRWQIQRSRWLIQVESA
jgi:hypothetical protein